MRAMPSSLRLLLFLAYFTASHAIASTPQLTFDTTERVRVEAPTVEPFPITGSFLGATGDTLIVSAPGQDYFLPIANVVRFEKSMGQRSGTAGGVILGLVVGAAAGAAIGSAATSDQQPDYGPSQGINIAGAVAVGALVGALIGGTIGSNMEGESWGTIPLNELRQQIRAHAAISAAKKPKDDSATVASSSSN